jgi:hypothetical protein
MKTLRLLNSHLLAAVLAGILATAVCGQSTSQEFPTPVTVNEINGTIRARDLGDGRLTTYFYTFSGEQGDVFINVTTSNFNGDVDLFTVDGLNPLTKIVMYADSSVNETGRVVYLRKPEKLLLRVEGRTPNDDPASFRIKFAGSFRAAADVAREVPALPEVRAENEAGIRVNSVGTIIEAPKPAPLKDTATETGEREAKRAEPAEVGLPEVSEAKPMPGVDKKKPFEVVVTDEASVTPPPKPPKKPRAEGRSARAKAPTRKAAQPSAGRAVKRKVPEKAIEPDPLENVRIVIEFKDGKRIERRMSDVLRFSVDKGVLTVISKDGSIGRYNILDVARTTIE